MEFYVLPAFCIIVAVSFFLGRMTATREPKVVQKSQRSRDFRDNIPLGLERVIIGPGESRYFKIQPQFIYRPTRFFVDPTGDGLILESFKVGNLEQFVGGNVPTGFFSLVKNGGLKGAPITADTADVGNIITMLVRNPTESPLPFSACFFGLTTNEVALAGSSMAEAIYNSGKLEELKLDDVHELYYNEKITAMEARNIARLGDFLGQLELAPEDEPKGPAAA